MAVALAAPLYSASAAVSEAEQQPAALDTIVVVSSRTETPLREIGTSVSVMDAAAIDARGFTSLADVLRTLPSVAVSNSGGMGKATSLRIRGEQGFRTLVRIDGVDISDPTGTQSSSQIQHLMSSGISRVELLRGPQGMMYGADAGGVLLISTDKATAEPSGFFTAEAGRYDSANTSAGVGGGSELGDFYLSGARVKTDGFNSHLTDVSGERDGYENNTFHARAGWNITSKVRLEAVARDTAAENEFDRCGWPATHACEGEFDQRNLRLGLTHATDHGGYTLAYSTTDVSRVDWTGGQVSYDTEGEISRAELNGNFRINPIHSLVYGLEQRNDEVLVQERDQTGVYLEYQGRYAERLFVTAGARQDDSDDFASHTSYRTSAAYLLPWVSSGVLKLKTSFGTGFRAPSLFEMDYNRQQQNPILSALTPEESRGLDGGVEYFAPNGNRFELVVFEQRIKEEIYFDLVNYSGYMQGNQTSEARGIELVAELLLTEFLTLNTNYTYIDTATDAGTPRSRQPKHLANLGLDYQPVDTLNFSVNLRAARDAIDLASGQALDDYQVLDASARYQVTDGAAIYVRGENILDEDYVEVPRYHTAGAAFYAGVSLTF